jgi:hypothetical protein
MSTTEHAGPKLDFRADDFEARLRPLANQVLAEFDLPSLRLYCYFADNEDAYLRQHIGKYFRGFHTSIEGRNQLPEYLSDCFFHPFDPFSDQEVTWEKMVAYDNLVYVTQQTSLDPTAFTLTFAHELQHFMQFGHARKVWVVNSILYEHIRSFDPFTPRTQVDIPHEREANIISKHIAEKVLGIETIKKFAQEQVDQFAVWARQGDECRE